MKKMITTMLLITSIMSGAVFAASTSVDKKYQEVEVNLKKNNPDLPIINEIRATPIDGIYEVVVNETELFYSTKDGKHMMFGSLVQAVDGTKVNLTEERMNQLTAIDFKLFNLSDAVVKKVGNGKDRIVTFEDPNCGFCKKLQPELAKLNNVTIYTFIVPILGPSSQEVSKNVWCSKDRLASWEGHFKGVKVEKASEKCDFSALTRNVDFSRKYKITGTPAIFFENGKSFKGYVPAERIMDALKK